MRKILIPALLASVALPAQAAVVYHNDFDAVFTVGAGIGLSVTDPGQFNQTAVGSWNAAGWAGRSYRNATAGNPAGLSELRFTNLGADIFIDGALVASLTAANASGNVWDTGGGTELARCVQADLRQFYCDTLVDWSKTFAHTGSSLTVGWQASGAGWQAGDDESWGLDNIKIDYFSRGGVPEPAAWAMMLAGFGMVGGAVRRRHATVRFS
jgi:hypothetical protein